MMNTEKFIIYACPVGELNEQINFYFQKSQERCGENPAHHYMPHCSLTGFFNANPNTIPDYLNSLDQTYHQSQNLSLDIKIVQMMFKPKWHGLELKASGLQHLIANFAEIMHHQPIEENIRLKDWLHISFAYKFQSQHHETLKKLAEKMINPESLTQWELRFYQKHSNGCWTCLQSWPL
ncbi:hypothetical protein [Lyngbya sp. PCC 8106]|uniref:hypothetical protein n=1 Tax=Lyngbya sp. (strain PCC 8106) TaxID=313612 RepID=UPI00030D896F|nr:hypothetical protein [Lyngbya sp. PCC 8106]